MDKDNKGAVYTFVLLVLRSSFMMFLRVAGGRYQYVTGKLINQFKSGTSTSYHRNRNATIYCLVDQLMSASAQDR